MRESLQGQVAVVTGAAEGIGAAIARALVAAGVDLAALDVKPIDCRVSYPRAASQQNIRAWQCDATSSPAVAAACAEIEASLGPVSILVNNVGGSGPVSIEQIEDMTDEAWNHVLSLSLTSIMRFSRAFVGGMKSRRYGRIVNVSSTLKSGFFGPVGTLGARLPYVAAKSAIDGLTRQLAKDLGPFGITVNALAPGLTFPGEDSRIAKRYRTLSPEAQKSLTAHIPAGRAASGEDMANMALFLASPASGYVSGQIIAVDGGA